jgi:lactoylglutathione lyase
MRLAKNHIDVGMFSNRRDEQLTFWQDTVGLEYDHMAKLGGGIQQHRHHMNGSIMKMNHARDPLPDEPPCGIYGLLIAREGLAEPQPMEDPDGNRLCLVPPGYRDVAGIGLVLHVNDLEATRRFYLDVLEMEEFAPGEFRCGDSMIFADQTGGVERATEWKAPGWRYFTLQIFDADDVTAKVEASGGEIAQPVKQLGDTVRFSMVRDPDGNHIELSQRSTLTGPLDS